MTVVGILSTGYYQYDTAWALIGREAGQKIRGTQGEATTLAVRATSLDDIPIARRGLEELLGPQYAVRDLTEMNQSLFAAFRAEKLIMGTDSPEAVHPAVAIEMIRALHLDKETEENILGGNISRLLDL